MDKDYITKKSYSASGPNWLKPWLIAIIFSVVILGLGLFLMNLVGLFAIPKDDTGTKTLAAALGLVGSILGSVVTLVGIVIKYAIDEWNYALAMQAERRNRIDTLIRAVGLLSENNQDAPKNKIGGALLALVDLGELELASDLLTNLWPNDKVSPMVAATVLENAIKSDSESAQTSAAIAIRQNARRIDQGNYQLWPIPAYGWNTDLCERCRWGLIVAAEDWLKTWIKNRDEPEPELPAPALVLYEALKDHNNDIVQYAVKLLRTVVDNDPEYQPVVVPGGPHLTVQEIKIRLLETEAHLAQPAKQAFRKR